MDEREIRDTIDIAQMGLAEKEAVTKASDEVRAYLGTLYEMSEKLKKTKHELKTKQGKISTNSAKGLLDYNDLQTEIDHFEEELAQVRIQIGLYEEFDHQLQDNLVQFKNFNKKRCIENIKALIKENPDAKIGVIEKDANVSLGYMSRLDKEDNRSDPSIEFIMAAAKILKVSVDALVSYDFANMTATQQYYINFLLKLKEQTETEQLEWIQEAADDLNRLGPGNVHPMFSFKEFYRKNETDYPDLVQDYVFVSHTFNCNTAIHDDCYALKMKDNSTLYLMNISKDVYKTNDATAFAKELWMWKPGMGATFIQSNRGDKEIATLLDSLYESIKEYMKHPKVNKDIKSIIDAFMNGDLGQGQPFDQDTPTN